jgi:hypothetical protein
MTIAAVTRIQTTVDHSWARNAADCAVSRAQIAGDACGRAWRGGSVGYMSVRHPMEGAAQSDWDRYGRETDGALVLQNMKRWHYIPD